MRDATLVVRPEKLGDLVVSTPVFRALKESYPNDALCVLTDQVYAEAIRHDPYVDNVIEVSWKGRRTGQHEPWRDIYNKLRGQNYSRAAILYYNLEQWNWMMFALGVKEVAQLGGTWSAPLLRHKMTLRKGYQARRHFAEMYLDVARLLGATAIESEPRLYVLPEEQVEFRERFPFLNDSSPKIILHPFGHGSSPNFSLQSYHQLARKLGEGNIGRLCITGGPAESIHWSGESLPNVDTAWLGKLSVREWMIASSLVDLVIAGSTGVIHAAAAVGTQTLGLYCPYIGSHPDIWGPRSQRAINLVAPQDFCKKIRLCGSSCTGNNSCDLAGGILPAQVAETVKGLLCGV